MILHTSFHFIPTPTSEVGVVIPVLKINLDPEKLNELLKNTLPGDTLGHFHHTELLSKPL